MVKFCTIILYQRLTGVSEEFNKSLAILSVNCLSKIEKIIKVITPVLERDISYYEFSCSIEEFSKIRLFLKEFNLEMSKIDDASKSVEIAINQITDNTIIRWVWCYIFSSKVKLQKNSKDPYDIINELFGKYLDRFSKKDILEFQKELMNSGYIGNARW